MRIFCLFIAALCSTIAQADRKLEYIGDPTLGRDNVKVKLTVTDEENVIIRDKVDELVVENCRMGKFSGSARVVIVRNSPGFGVQKFEGKQTGEAEKQFEFFDSPNSWIADSRIKGPTFAWASEGFTYARNNLDMRHSILEGVELRGKGNFLVEDNTMQGDYMKTNDLIEIGPNLPIPKRMDAFNWPNRSSLILDPVYTPQPGWRYLTDTFLSGPNIGRSITYGYPLKDWVKNVVVRRNKMDGARIAGMFLYCVDNFRVYDNEVSNTSDYNLGAEWCDNGIFFNNTLRQDRDKQIRTGGGLSVMQSINNVQIVDNKLDGSNIYIRPWGYPITNVTVQNNYLKTPFDSARGKIWVMYEGVLWAKGIHIRYNKLDGGWIDINSSPFYTEGTIIGNEVNRFGYDPTGGWTQHTDNRFGISLESFKGEVTDNKVNGARFPIRDFNVGPDRLTSIVFGGNNTADGVEAKILVSDKNKPPVFEVPLPNEPSIPPSVTLSSF